MSSDRENQRETRREAMKQLATALRRLTDVAVCTDLAPGEVEAATRHVESLTAELAREQHDGPYSGLLPKQRDYDRPHHAMPLSPIIGDLNPIRPEVRVELREGRVYGTAVLSKKFVGPAGFAHGGVTAMICDQLVALAARAAGLRGLTASIEVRYRRPTPLYRELSLEGWCERDGGEREAHAFCEIRAEDELTVSARARMVVADWVHSAPRSAAPPARVEGPQRQT